VDEVALLGHHPQKVKGVDVEVDVEDRTNHQECNQTQ